MHNLNRGKNVCYFCYFQNNTQRKLSPVGRKFAQSGNSESKTEAETQGAVAPCKKMAIGEKDWRDAREHAIIPGQEATLWGAAVAQR
jgi:hypothetical protein